jgi:hypothetical protein
MVGAKTRDPPSSNNHHPKHNEMVKLTGNEGNPIGTTESHGVNSAKELIKKKQQHEKKGRLSWLHDFFPIR